MAKQRYAVAVYGNNVWHSPRLFPAKELADSYTAYMVENAKPEVGRDVVVVGWSADRMFFACRVYLDGSGTRATEKLNKERLATDYGLRF